MATASPATPVAFAHRNDTAASMPPAGAPWRSLARSPVGQHQVHDVALVPVGANDAIRSVAQAVGQGVAHPAAQAVSIGPSDHGLDAVADSVVEDQIVVAGDLGALQVEIGDVGHA